ncbi:YIP1 family protein [Halorhodospira halochloris]|nr:Yip1 family protein [Halorhodospira halochloris]MBK1651406.1 YIP1 family protein [Halorhodospira halochloris]MCG5530133.1 YIP1 family protein [Halorhodospira halochloris]MCG5548405.1 YIP1 family protein [Halorhodospira halochloris]
MSSYPLPRNPAGDALLGVFLRPRRLLFAWRDAEPETFWVLTRLTIPVLLLSILGSGIAHEFIPSGFPPHTRPDPVGFAIYSGLTHLVGVLALAAAAHYLCDLFQGYSDFNRALAAVSIGMVPAWIGNIVAALPWPIGAYGAIILILYSFVLIYAAFAVIMDIQRGHRLAHYIAAIIAALLITFAFGWQAMSIIPGASPEVRLGTTWLI